MKKSLLSKRRIKQLLVLMSSIVLTESTYSNPEGGNVTAGSATITQSPGDTQIHQSTDKAVIEWRSFNVGVGERTQFVQPSTSAITLNRIDANQGVSQIFGQITANGQIILINQAGIYFSPSSRVDVGGMIASTTDITNKNFLAGIYIFDQASPHAGSVINQGVIHVANHGLLALVGTGVRNDGTIEARLGNVVLASGNKFTLDLYGDQLIQFTVDEAATRTGLDQNGQALKHAVSNTGNVIADGGKIIMTAKAAAGVVDRVVNMEGVLQARSVAQRNGEIILIGGNQGVVHVSGKIIASGKSYGQRGGKVHITGKYVKLDKPAEIDASGDVGGGEVLVGGDKLGGGTLSHALATIVMPGVSINADAITEGSGGKVIVWADDVTRYYGSITARGGSVSGNGGLVETSGKNYLDITGGKVYTSASNGKTGEWLLDPGDIYLSSNATSPIPLSDWQSPANATCPAGAGIYCGPQAASVFNINDLLTQLASNSISIIATAGNGNLGSIYIPSGTGSINDTSSPIPAGNTLTLTADAGIIFFGNSATATTINLNGSIVFNGAVSLASDFNGPTGISITSRNGSLTFNGSISGNSSVPSQANTLNLAMLNTLTLNNVSGLNQLHVQGLGNQSNVQFNAPVRLNRTTGVASMNSQNLQFANVKSYSGQISPVLTPAETAAVTGMVNQFTYSDAPYSPANHDMTTKMIYAPFKKPAGENLIQVAHERVLPLKVHSVGAESFNITLASAKLEKVITPISTKQVAITNAALAKPQKIRMEYAALGTATHHDIVSSMGPQSDASIASFANAVTSFNIRSLATMKRDVAPAPKVIYAMNEGLIKSHVSSKLVYAANNANSKPFDVKALHSKIITANAPNVRFEAAPVVVAKLDFPVKAKLTQSVVQHNVVGMDALNPRLAFNTKALMVPSAPLRSENIKLAKADISFDSQRWIESTLVLRDVQRKKPVAASEAPKIAKPALAPAPEKEYVFVVNNAKPQVNEDLVRFANQDDKKIMRIKPTGANSFDIN